MKILIDECIPAKSKPEWRGHEVFTTSEMGWTGKKDKELLNLMAGRFDLFLTLSDSPGQKIAIYRVIPASEIASPALQPVLSDTPQTLERIRNWLYEIPIEKLGISQIAINRLKRTGVTAIGDCIDFFERVEAGSGAGCFRFGFLEAMFDDVKPKLEEKGYWPLTED